MCQVATLTSLGDLQNWSRIGGDLFIHSGLLAFPEVMAMSASRLALLASLGLLAVPLTTWAAEPPPELVPPPIPAPMMFSQPNPYDVWQAYGVDRYGRFRPLVVLTPAGPFRVADGAYYPFMPTQQMNVIPTV